MPTASPDTLRKRLRELGQRRKTNETADEALAKEIREALDAAEGVVSTTEAANLLGIHRTTLYRVYRHR